MNKRKHQSKINFNYILDVCKKRYIPFDKEVKIKRKPLSLIKAIEAAKKKGQNPVISEIKYRSPTVENKKTGRPEEIACKMIRGGACAISFLTEP
jgi:indole-3-glycerol phosphate synthase